MPDNSVKYVHVVAHALSDKSGRTEFVGAVMDATERKCAEEALREAQANLARVSRMTTMGELTASVAHEIKQPIRSEEHTSELQSRLQPLCRLLLEKKNNSR